MDCEMNTNPNMKPCETCGQLIAKTAKKCPHCGAKVKRPIYKNGCLISILVFILILIATVATVYIVVTKPFEDFSSIGNAAPEEYIIVNGETISLEDFAKEIEDNEVKFDSNYKGEYVTIVARVKEIEGGFLQTNLNHTFKAVITLNGGSFMNKFCVEAGSKSKAAQFEVGDLVKVEGKLTTDLYGTSFFMYGPNTITKVSE